MDLGQLSPLLAETAFGPVVLSLLAQPRLPELGPGNPNAANRQTLQALTLADLFDNQQPTNPASARLVIAGLWLHFDFLDEAHQICQADESPAGSYWHAIMHRREPDASNAKYWFRRVGSHPVLTQLPAAARQIGYEFRSAAGFVDDCETYRGTNSPPEQLARQVQLLEWQLLLAHCHRLALG